MAPGTLSSFYRKIRAAKRRCTCILENDHVTQSSQSTILFAGGGTGGHLFPSLAIAQRLADVPGAPAAHFLASDRAIDAQILTKAGVNFTACPMKPLPTRPWTIPGFVLSLVRSKKMVREIVKQRNVKLIVAMGGFVSVPAAMVGRALGIPILLVNLDAVPGKANRWLAKRCDELYSVYESPLLPSGRVKMTGLPLRRSGLSNGDARTDRVAMGLDADRPTLLVTGASQGAKSINLAMVELLKQDDFRAAIGAWQVLHLAGEGVGDELEKAYRAANVPARVMTFCDTMGHAWGGADLAISRAGANSVAEVAANGVPTIFLPYPYHKDQHQKLNVEPLSRGGAAVLMKDAIDPAVNAERLRPVMMELMGDAGRRAAMREKLLKLGGGDGAKKLMDVAMSIVARSG